MGRLRILSDLFQQFPFEKHYKSAKNARSKIRLLGCYHIQQGNSYDNTANMLKVNRKTVMSWVKSFEIGGMDTLLTDKKGRGKKPRLPIDKEELFCDKVVNLQQTRSGGRVTGKDIVKMIDENFKINYSVSGIYKLLHRLNMSWVSARSIHPKTDIEVQTAFKKTSQKS